MSSALELGSSGPAVKEVQKLLNRQLTPSPKLAEDGRFGNATAVALKEFQRKNRLKVDGIAGRETLAKLKGGGSGSAPAAPKDAHKSRSSFVDSQVKENATAAKIIDQIWPYFPKSARVISAYLTPSDLYWKVNYHWDAMRTWLEWADGQDAVTDDEKKVLSTIYRNLMSNAPSQCGQYKLNKIGKPEDRSPLATIEKRCESLKDIKKKLKAYCSTQGFDSRNMKNTALLKYALNPIALPERSNHVHGWALDIAGDIRENAAIAVSLGATLAYKEETHCHCEFRNGVKLPR